ncbi:MAG: phosphotriesterase [Deltaproteobacteria bacterium]|nr:phosphotriesterase [Deltaproteobacteria bacterium]
MNFIMTVTGPIAPEKLGFASMHEHVFTDAIFAEDAFATLVGTPLKHEDPPNIDKSIGMADLHPRHGDFIRSKDNWELDDETLMIAEVADFKTAGGNAILECSTPSIRRNVVGLKRISEKTGVNIIASTGLYGEETWPDKFKDMSIDDFAAFMKYEIQYGIMETDFKAGHIKTSVNKITERQIDFIKAAARVANDTGVLATVHLGLLTTEEDNRLVYKAFLDAGIAPERLLMCNQQIFFHEVNLETLITNTDTWKLKLDSARDVLERGINICIDGFGRNWDVEALGIISPKDHVLMAALVALIKEGYTHQLVIGTDVSHKIMTRRHGGYGYCRLLNYVVPTLKKVGVSDEDIRKITVENPSRMLSVRS